MSGKYGMERTPVAATKWCARVTVPLSSVTVHSAARSSYSADVTRASKRMWRRRSKRSTTWFR